MRYFLLQEISMSKRFVLLLFVAISCVLVGCKGVEPDQVKLSTHVLQLKVGEVHILTAVATQEVIWQSSDTLVAEVMKDFGKIDILVNNAGITKDGLLMRMTEEQWDMVINTNLKSAFNYIHALTPIMMKQRSGSIINMTSIVGISGNAGQANYAASKAGMIGLTKSVAKELGSRGIRVNAIAPGFIATEMTGVLNEDTKKQWILNIPLRREGKVEDVANVAVFLASDLASYVSGQVINCCGGLNM